MIVPPVMPEPPSRPARRTIVGTWMLVGAMLALTLLAFVPTGFVIEQPGPVYNTVGTAPDSEGKDVPLITVSDARTYDTAGTLSLTTVGVVGNPEQTPNWFEVATAWLDRSKAVMPLESVFPQGQTATQRQNDNQILMDDSQKEATAAALVQLGYDVAPRLTVVSLPDQSASAGILEPGDVIRSAAGTDLVDVSTLRALIAEGAGAPISLGIERSGVPREVTVTPTETSTESGPVYTIGVLLTTDFTFPIDVAIQLNNVGGPSAGMMFALGIIDMLTPGELNGGAQVAGTGTIDAAGEVGPIGGIRQKLYGARAAGAAYFLAPAANCAEVGENIPDGLQVVRVATLTDSLDALEAIAAGDATRLPSCATS